MRTLHHGDIRTPSGATQRAEMDFDRVSHRDNTIICWRSLILNLDSEAPKNTHPPKSQQPQAELIRWDCLLEAAVAKQLLAHMAELALVRIDVLLSFVHFKILDGFLGGPRILLPGQRKAPPTGGAFTPMGSRGAAFFLLHRNDITIASTATPAMKTGGSDL